MTLTFHLSMTARSWCAYLTATVLLACCACGSPTEPAPADSSLQEGPAATIEERWEPAFGDDGPREADRLIRLRTPGCVTPSGAERLERWADGMRRRMVAAMGLDLDRTAVGVVQRSLRRAGYSIDVVRLETFPGIYMPASVYVPVSAGSGGAPLVISPTGCGSGLGSPHVQIRAANLALRGMVVLVTEGFCDNGARASLADSNPRVGYARQLLGLPGDVAVYLQELISARGWVTQTYPIVDPDRVGVAGYSYGGQMALLLAQVDRRIASVSVPATHFGGSCDGFRLPSDIQLEDSPRHGPDFVWSPPPELPVLPVNWRAAMISPRPFHTTSGRHDPGAHPDEIGRAIGYMKTLYAAAGRTADLLYRVDDGDHHYGSNRRLDTYEWLERTLLDERSRLDGELSVAEVDAGALAVDISGTRTLAQELAEHVASERLLRFSDGRPTDGVRERMATATDALFAGREMGDVTDNLAWETTAGTIRLRAHRFRAGGIPLAVFELESIAKTGTDSSPAPARRRLVYLPQRGTRAELARLVGLLDEYRQVVSIDYPGIGELKSDRLLLHTFSRYFMHDRDALPTLNVSLLRAYLRSGDPGTRDILGRGWASSFYALVLKHLEPERVGTVRACGPPVDELGHLAEGGKIPNLLLQGGLFSELTAAELAAALEPAEVDLTTGPCP